MFRKEKTIIYTHIKLSHLIDMTKQPKIHKQILDMIVRYYCRKLKTKYSHLYIESKLLKLTSVLPYQIVVFTFKKIPHSERNIWQHYIYIYCETDFLITKILFKIKKKLQPIRLCTVSWTFLLVHVTVFFQLFWNESFRTTQNWNLKGKITTHEKTESYRHMSILNIVWTYTFYQYSMCYWHATQFSLFNELIIPMFSTIKTYNFAA